ncbi:MAG: hypothetical protein ABIA78_01905 [archaeon]
MGLRINYKNNEFDLDVKKVSELGKISGLMFCRRENARTLLFEFNKSTRMAIHSWFVFFPFIAIWLDDKNQVVEIKKITSWRSYIVPKRKFSKLIEIPCNEKYEELIKEINLRR